MVKVFCVFVVVFSISVSAQHYPNYAYPQGYLMQEGNQAQQQNMNSIANWWGCKRGKITDTCPLLISTKWGSDSLYCYAISNYSGTDKLVKFLGDNNRTDTIPITVPSGSITNKLPKIWKLVSTSNTSLTMDSLVLWFQNGKKLSTDF